MLWVFGYPDLALGRPNNISVVLNHLLDRPLTRLSCPIRSTTYRVNGAEACLSTDNTTRLSTLPHRVLKPHHLFPLPLGSHTGDQKYQLLDTGSYNLRLLPSHLHPDKLSSEGASSSEYFKTYPISFLLPNSNNCQSWIFLLKFMLMKEITSTCTSRR